MIPQLSDFDIQWRMLENRRVYYTYYSLWVCTELLSVLMIVMIMIDAECDKFSGRLN
jgi:hypothetical protein